MPTYDYECTACQHAWEEFHSIKAQPTKKCPACGKNKAERQVGIGAGIIFKGSGFYITDYRSDSYKDAATKDSGKAESNTKVDSTPSSDASPKGDASSQSVSSSPSDAGAKSETPVAKSTRKSAGKSSSTNTKPE